MSSHHWAEPDQEPGAASWTPVWPRPTDDTDVEELVRAGCRITDARELGVLADRAAVYPGEWAHCWHTPDGLG